MANAAVEALVGVSGLTLSMDLYPLGSDTIAVNGQALTEATNRKGLYTATFSSTGLSGEYQAFIYPTGSAAQRIYVGYVQMTDAASLHRVVDNAADASVDITGCSSNAGAVNGNATAAADLADFATNGYTVGKHKVNEVALVDTLTTYTNDTPQSGDSYARIAAPGAGLTALASAANLATVNTNLNSLITTVGVAGAGLTSLASAANLSSLTTTVGTVNTNLSAL